MNTSRSLSVDQLDKRKREITLRTPRVLASSDERGSRVLEIQLIDERSLVRQTETGMWEEALGARAETGRRRRRRRRKGERGEEGVMPGLFRSRVRSLISTRRTRVPPRIMYDRTRWSRVPENHERPS